MWADLKQNSSQLSSIIEDTTALQKLSSQITQNANEIDEK